MTTKNYVVAAPADDAPESGGLVEIGGLAEKKKPPEKGPTAVELLNQAAAILEATGGHRAKTLWLIAAQVRQIAERVAGL